MKKLYTFFFLLILSSFFHRSVAQIVSFSFAGSEGDESTWPTCSQSTGVMPSAITRGPGVSAVANADRFNSKSWTTGSIPDMNDYLEFTVTPKAGYGITLSTIALQHQRSVTGPRSFVIRTNMDAFAADATNAVNIADVNSNQSSSFIFPTAISTTSPLIIRIYAYNAETANGTWGPGESTDGNDMSLSGSFRILPVHFVNVAALLKGKEVEVSWTNATESDVLQYVVERSANGQQFAELTKVNNVKNDGEKVNYRSADLQPLNKANYYRIKAVETTGRVLYSSVVKIEVSSSATSLGLYPNPVMQGAQVMLQVNGVSAGKYDVRVYNAAAQLVHHEAITVNGTSSTQSIAVAQFQKGMYVMEVSGAQRMQQQFIIQ